MTVQCTECGSQFEVPEPALDPNGLQVECAHCGAALHIETAPENPPDDHGWLHAPRSNPESGLNESELFGSTSEPEPSASGAHSVDVVPQEALLRPGTAPPTLPAPAEVSRQPTLADELFEEEATLSASEDDNWLEAPETGGAARVQPTLKDALPPPPSELEEPSVRSAERRGEASAPGLATAVGAPRVMVLGVRVSVAAFLALAVAAGGTIYLNGGKLDASAFSKTRLKVLFGSGRGLVTRDVSNGLYETRSGASVFYVRGIVENRGTSSGWVNVHAEIFDGSQLLRTVEGLAGATCSPEDLFRVESAEEASAFNARQGQSVAKVSPGQQAPFLLALYDPPPDLSGFQIRVTASLADRTQSAAR